MKERFDFSTPQTCIFCGNETGRPDEDPIVYIEDGEKIGPLCEECLLQYELSEEE